MKLEVLARENYCLHLLNIHYCAALGSRATEAFLGVFESISRLTAVIDVSIAMLLHYMNTVV